MVDCPIGSAPWGQKHNTCSILYTTPQASQWALLAILMRKGYAFAKETRNRCLQSNFDSLFARGRLLLESMWHKMEMHTFTLTFDSRF